MKKIAKIAFFLICLGGLIIFQRDAVMPNVYKVISSDLLLEDSDDLGSSSAIQNSMTDYAHQHCNELLRNEYGEDFNFTVSDKAINTWDIGAYDYVVNAEITIQPKDGPSYQQKYICRIKFEGEQPNNIEEWDLYDFSGLDDL